MKTFSAKPGDVEQQWFVVDASGKTLGRVATAIASRLRGKHKPEFTPHTDTGDFIVVVNAGKIHVTGNKGRDKINHHHTGTPVACAASVSTSLSTGHLPVLWRQP